MPTYEYKCDTCQKVFEHFQKITEPPLEKCPKCHGKVSRLISATSFSLKGSGWYKDGYSSAGSSCGSCAGKSECPKEKKK